VLGDEDGDMLAVGTSPLNDGGHVQVPPVSDRDSVFTSQFWSDLCYLNRVHRKLSTAFHPQTDGQTERNNQTLIQYLRCFAAANPTIWAHVLPEAEFVCNNAVNATTNLSPFEH
jgi:transposase InsO family protein